MTNTILLRTGEEIVENVKSLQSLATIPASLQVALTELSNPEPDITKLADVILKDQVLTGKVLRLVNSPFIGLLRKVNSVKQAIVLLGLRQLRDLLVTTLVIENFPLNNPKLPPKIFWKHALGCARTTSFLGLLFQYAEPEKTYLAGLLHDIGRLVLAQNFPDEFQFIYRIASEEKRSLYEVERESLGISHAELGEILAQNWKFPDYLVPVIGFHHEPQKCDEYQELTALVNLADLFTHHFGLHYGYTEKSSIRLKNQEAFLLLTSLNPSIEPADLINISEEIRTRLVDIVRAVEIYFD